MRPSPAVMAAYERNYTTSDEIAFLCGLASGRAISRGKMYGSNGWAGKGGNPAALLVYARLVMGGFRQYDSGVDVARVRACICDLMPAVGGKV